MTYVDVNGARIWVEEQGDGPAVLFVHGGLGDLRLWEPQASALARRFRCIRFDLRLFGRTESPGVEFSWPDDAVGLLDALGVERAALVGLSMGGGIALDVAAAHPERVWALVHVAAGVSGMPVDPYTEEQSAVFEGDDVDAMMAADLAVWAPLGTTPEIEELWRATPDALGVPDGAAPQPRPDVVLEDVDVPTLVIVPEHDPPAQREVGLAVAHRIPGARLVELDSDHYLTLREPERVTAAIEDFLVSVSPPATS